MLNKNLSECKQLTNQRRCCRTDIAFSKAIVQSAGSVKWLVVNFMTRIRFPEESRLLIFAAASRPSLGPILPFICYSEGCYSGQTVAGTATVL